MSNHIFIIQGILDKTALDPKEVDYLYYGTVIQESKTSNIAREASMGAGIPISVPSHTVTQACISSVQALTTGAESSQEGLHAPVHHPPSLKVIMLHGLQHYCASLFST